MKGFLLFNENIYTYDDLIKDLNQTRHYKKFIKELNVYELFVQLIYAIVCNNQVTLLDSDLSEKEIENLGIKNFDQTYNYSLSVPIHSFNDLKKRIRNNSNWELEIFTSGTTGRPKSIKQNLSNLTRMVKEDKKHLNDRWAFCYNPTHFAGLQVFFQAFLNQNMMVYLFGSEPSSIIDKVDKFNITHISATPTFYKQILIKNKTIDSVKRITMGGERYDTNIKEKILKLFPNAKITNVYASTEAGSIFASDGKFFKIPDELKDKVMISEDGELLIHRYLLGNSQSLKLEGEWYRTGDIIEVKDENKFQFISRKSELINVGGYKVNPLEIESLINNIDGVIQVQVMGRKNSITGNVVVANVLTDELTDKSILKTTIIQICSANLQEWKIPRIIKFVDSIELTRTGKLKR